MVAVAGFNTNILYNSEPVRNSEPYSESEPVRAFGTSGMKFIIYINLAFLANKLIIYRWPICIDVVKNYEWASEWLANLWGEKTVYKCIL